MCRKITNAGPPPPALQPHGMQPDTPVSGTHGSPTGMHEGKQVTISSTGEARNQVGNIRQPDSRQVSRFRRLARFIRDTIGKLIARLSPRTRQNTPEQEAPVRSSPAAPDRDVSVPTSGSPEKWTESVTSLTDRDVSAPASGPPPEFQVWSEIHNEIDKLQREINDNLALAQQHGDITPRWQQQAEMLDQLTEQWYKASLGEDEATKSENYSISPDSQARLDEAKEVARDLLSAYRYILRDKQPVTRKRQSQLQERVNRFTGWRQPDGQKKAGQTVLGKPDAGSKAPIGDAFVRARCREVLREAGQTVASRKIHVPPALVQEIREEAGKQRGLKSSEEVAHGIIKAYYESNGYPGKKEPVTGKETGV